MVKVKMEPKSIRKAFPRPSEREKCCLCGRPTRFWHVHKTRDCALCPDCAIDAKTSDIPLKTEWNEKVDRENKANQCYSHRND